MVETATLTPIREASIRFDVPMSTLHYWERRGLITPSRRAGQRCYDTDQLSRIALIRLWRFTGGIGIAQIARMLDDPHWQDRVADRLTEIEDQLASLETARAYLNHLLTCRQPAPERCPEFRASVGLG